MKRIMAFAVSQLYSLVNSCRWLKVAGVLLMTIALVGSANAQSKDRENPTRLTSTVISGVIGDNLGDSYYYTFVAGPGEVTLTLTLEGNKSRISSINFMDFELFNENRRKLISRHVIAARSNAQAVERINFSRRQRVLLLIRISDSNSGSAKYWLRLSGPVDVSQDMPSERDTVGGIGEETGIRVSPSKRVPEAKESCLPKQGTLIVKMKDGSKKIIDLSEAETITVVP